MTCLETAIFGKFGYSIPDVISVDSDEGKRAIECGRYIRIFRGGEFLHSGNSAMTTITLSAHMTNTDEPVIERSASSFSVCMSDHADFDGTLEYIRATNAKEVVTDNTRAGYGVELAQEIIASLGIKARPSSNLYDEGIRSR